MVDNTSFHDSIHSQIAPPHHSFTVKSVNRYMAGRERIVDKVSCFVDMEESFIDS